MAASGTVAKGQEIEFKALEGSLSMMSKVLNDVLDFNRMDSGRFESVSRPYPFHKVMRSLFVPLRMATDARGLSFATELDKGIDDISRKALYEAQGMSEQEALRRIAEHPDEDGIMVGDETRLRQIVTNLARCAPIGTLADSTAHVSVQQCVQVYSGRRATHHHNPAHPSARHNSVAARLGDAHHLRHLQGAKGTRK